jgi:hypothetical protein
LKFGQNFYFMVKFRQILDIKRRKKKKNKICAPYLSSKPFSIVSGQHLKCIVENSERH